MEQHSDLWYEKRKRMVTASDFPAVLNQNPYKTRNQLMRMKLGDKKYQFNGNAATQWGNMLEDEAAQVYSEKYNTHCLWFGLIGHTEYPWLGGSADRVTPDGILVEIKCPLRREIKHEIPGHYMGQVQGLMYILDLQVAHFVQYRPETTWSPMEFDVVEIKRDPVWWKLSFPLLKSFYHEWCEKLLTYKPDEEDDRAVVKIKANGGGTKPKKIKERTPVYQFWYPFPLKTASKDVAYRRYHSSPISAPTGTAAEFFNFTAETSA